MAGRSKIGLREIRALGLNQEIWDSAVTGFGARRQHSAAVSYVLMYRTANGRLRRHTIGRHGSPWTPDMARDEARRILGSVVSGNDPAGEKTAMRNAPAVADLCDQYWQDAEAGRLLTQRRTPKKPSTLATDKGRIERHIKPVLGTLKIASVTRDDIERFMHAVAEGQTATRTKTSRKRGVANVRGGRGTASRTVGLLGAIFSYAVHKRMRPDNPCRGVMRFADGKRERRLSDDEYAALGQGLREASASVWPAAIAAVRFLALTGWRSGEVLGLCWSELDLARRTATLPDTKTGRSIRPLSHAAIEALHSLPNTCELIFPATRGGVRMVGFPKIWARIAKLGTLPADVTPHVLRHSFASLAADLGYSEPAIAALVGHKGRTITSRYVHAADTVLLAAADNVANKTAELMRERDRQALVVPLRRSAGDSA